MKQSRALRRLKRDILLIVFSSIIAITLLQIGVLGNVLTAAQDTQFVGAFVAGIFFTSAFTTAIATIALGAISLTNAPISVALWGALGASFGDFLMFVFLRDELASDMKAVVKKSDYRKVLSFFHVGFVRWFAPIVGALIIASPLPDELGLALMGLSNVRSIYIIPLAFAMNFIGIFAIASVAHSL